MLPVKSGYAFTGSWPRSTLHPFLYPITDFRTKDAVPKDGPEYLTYLENSNAFISARNRRIDEQP